MKIPTTRIACAAALAAAMAVIPGCAGKSPSPAPRVARSETGLSHTMDKGEVVYVREVVIEGESGVAGALAGGVLGLAVGDQFGGGRARNLTRAAGAVGGAAAGSAVAQRVTEQTGLEITVQLDNGEVVVVIQAADESFRVGDSVRVLRRADGQARVVQ